MPQPLKISYTSRAGVNLSVIYFIHFSATFTRLIDLSFPHLLSLSLTPLSICTYLVLCVLFIFYYTRLHPFLWYLYIPSALCFFLLIQDFIHFCDTSHILQDAFNIYLFKISIQYILIPVLVYRLCPVYYFVNQILSLLITPR